MRSAFLLACCVLCLIVAPVGAQSIAGEWEGAIEIPGSPLAIEVSLSTAEGAWAGTINIPAQNLRDFALSGVEVEADSVHFVMEGVPGRPTFRGAHDADADHVTGTFSQGNAAFPFTLARAAAAQAEEATRDAERLADLDTLVATAMEAWKVPGLALAVVRKDTVLRIGGYGFREVESEAPVTPQTLFAIGSSTKAFTAAVLGTFVDEGLLDWEDPVREHLSSFALYDPVATAEMTAVDLLTHRSGLPRHDLAWYGTEASRADLLEGLQYLEPSAPFRSRWQYQNLMYMTAGVLAGHLDGSTWEDAVQTRLFAPLGMTEANFSIETMRSAEDRARPYAGGTDRIEPMDDYRNIDAIGPAGSINAHITDMAKWAQFQLSDGTVGGAEVLASGTLETLHRPQMVLGEASGEAFTYQMYALGWFVQPFHGHKMLHHGGNIDGFSAMVGFLPDDDLAVVVLTNKNGSGAPTALMRTIFDRYLDGGVNWVDQMKPSTEEEEETDREEDVDEADVRVAGTTPAHPLTAYAGRYAHPAYGAVAIEVERDSLVLNHPAFEAATLEHVHYEVFALNTGALAGRRIQFQTDLDGQIEAMTAQLEVGVEPIVFEREAEAEWQDPAYLEAFVGRYAFNEVLITVERQGEALRMTVPGQPIYTLEPVADHLFGLADLSGYRVRFLEEEGAVVRAQFIQPNGTFMATRQ
ncbi:MAG: serine hydrolase [Bacteroidota bacterium]